MTRTILGCAVMIIALTGSASADDTPEPKGNFMSSLKQSFRHDYDHEVVRGHFDVGTPPDSHRYFCLIDPKSGKQEANGIAGTPTKRKDGMTVIQGAAVSFYNCADAETKGILVTSDYQVTLAPGAHAQAAPPPSAAPAAASPAAAPAGAAAAASPAVAEDRYKSSLADPLLTLQGFIDAYNTGDGVSLVALLAESADFVWVQPDGHTLWGHHAAADALKASRAAGSLLQFQSQDGHTISLPSRTAILVTRVRFIQVGQDPRVIRCSSVMVQTAKGWRIASLFMTPEAG